MESDLTLNEVFQAYWDCRRGKRNTYQQLEFEHHLERTLIDLYDDLINWPISGYLNNLT